MMIAETRQSCKTLLQHSIFKLFKNVRQIKNLFGNGTFIFDRVHILHSVMRQVFGGYKRMRNLLSTPMKIKFTVLCILSVNQQQSV